MSTLLANVAIQGAVAAILLACAALIAAVANWFNVRTRLMEQGLQIADLQRQTNHLAAVQDVRAATPLPSPPPTIVTVPAAAVVAPAPQAAAPDA